jgi:hemerythrin-like domain-containing protein
MRSGSIVYDGRMLRDPNLIPLSRQHQHALALCVRLDRAIQAGQIDLEAWQLEIQQLVDSEIGIHFAAEEKELFPAAARFTEMQALVAELRAEHSLLRDYFARAAGLSLDRQSLGTLGEKLAQHIRKEERQLFEGMQKVMSSQELAMLGSALNEALKDASQMCALPNEATRLRSKP